MLKRSKIFFFILVLLSQKMYSQDLDALFAKAREQAFAGKNEKARELCQQILQNKPNYLDAEVLFGRTLAWDKMHDSARVVFQKAFAENHDYKDLTLAYTDNEIWSENYANGLKICNQFLENNLQDRDILFRKAKILNFLGEKKQALKLAENLHKLNPNDKEITDFLQKLKEELLSQTIDFQYAFKIINKPFKRQTHIQSVSYSVKTPSFTIIPRLNSGQHVFEGSNFFEDVGWQLETDAYVNFTPKLYSYWNFGISDQTFFPKLRAGFELFTVLPLATEASAGFRYLQFVQNNQKNNVIVYTASAGIYVKNLWFSLRTFLTPQNNEISQTYLFSVRNYFENPENYVFVMLGSGSSPDNPLKNINSFKDYKLNSLRIYSGIQWQLNRKLILNTFLGIEKEEYNPNLFRNAFTINCSLALKL